MIASSSSSSAAAANCNGGEQHFLQRRRRIFSSALASTSGASSSRWSPSNSWTTGRTRRDKRRRRRRRRRRNDDDESDDGVVRSFPPLRARKTRYEYEREKDDDELRKDEDLELLRDLMLEDNTEEEEEEEEDDEEEDETLGRTTRRRRRTKADINAGAGGDDFETLVTPRAKYRARIDASPDATWEAVSDASLFSTFAPNVRTSLRSFSSSGGVSTYRLASDCRDEVILCANELRGEIFLEVVLLPPEKATMSSSSSSSSSSQLISSKDTLANRRKKQPEAPTISRTLSFSSRDVDRRNGEFECFGKIKVARLKSASFACELSYECEIRPTKYPVLRRALERVMRQSFEEIATAINQRASAHYGREHGC